MGIEPTRSLFPDPSSVLKTEAGTSRTHAPVYGYVVILEHGIQKRKMPLWARL